MDTRKVCMFFLFLKATLYTITKNINMCHKLLSLIQHTTSIPSNLLYKVTFQCVYPLAHLLLYFSKHRPSGPMLSISRNVRPCVRLFVCLSVCLFTFEVPFKRLFAPTSRSRMSKTFRDSESLGKSNGKKWSQI